MGAKARDIQRVLADLADPEIAKVSRRFFKAEPGGYGEGDRFRGIRVPVLRRVAREHRDAPLEEARKLLTSSFHEDRLTALFLLVRKFAEGDGETRRTIYELYLTHTRFVNNWDLTDASAEHIVDAHLWDKDRAPLYQLAVSSNLWERRIAILATFHFIKQGAFEDTLRLAERLLKDTEDLIHKACGWMLREVAKRDAAAAEAFLEAHVRQMPRVMLRYAIERLPEAQRQAWLKAR